MREHKWCKVLIVDDELLIRQGIKHYINWEQEGFQIVGEASNGKEALDLIEATKPHIVITDMVMPVMDGEQLTRVIKSNYPQIEIIILSSFGDFDYVRSTFQHGVSDYILKPQLEGPDLLKALKQAADKIPGFTLMAKDSNDTTISIKNVIEEIMIGYEIAEDDPIIQQTFPHSHYCLVGIDFKKRINHKQIDYQLLTEEVEQRMRSAFSHIVIEQLPADQYVTAYLLNCERHQLLTIKQFVATISASHTFIDTGVGWVLTEPFTHFVQLKAVYQQKLLPLIHYRFYLPEMLALIYDEIPSVPKIDAPFQLTKFTEAFKRKQFETAFLYLEDHIEDLIQQYTTDEFSFKSFLGNIIFNITTLLENMKYEIMQLEQEKYTYIASIDEALNAREALAVLHGYLAEAKSIIKGESVNFHHPKMQRLLDYIDAHYAEPLNLTEMANHFHYNPSYLSSYFSENSEQGFSEYLNQVRIQKSVEQLEKGTESIAEISSLVGYSDHSYYCKVFKSSMGTSPSSYRRQYFRARKKHK